MGPGRPERKQHSPTLDCSGGLWARECIFGRGQDLDWSLAFYGEEADWEGLSGFPVVPLYPPPPSLLAALLAEHGCPRDGGRPFP